VTEGNSKLNNSELAEKETQLKWEGNEGEGAVLTIPNAQSDTMLYLALCEQDSSPKPKAVILAFGVLDLGEAQIFTRKNSKGKFR
jgi:hypothetical protein